MAFAPPSYTQNLAYTAQDDRQIAALMLAPGVYGVINSLFVNAGSGMNSNVAAGRGVVPNTFQTQGGLYVVRSPTVSSVLHGTADVTNPRVDTVYVKVWDSTDGGDTSDALPAPGILQGTPTSGATFTNLLGVAPSLPNNSLLLSYVLVHAGDIAASSFTYLDMRTVYGIWVPLTLGTNIVAGSAIVPSALLDVNGLVHLKGSLVNSGGLMSGANLATISRGLRPNVAISPIVNYLLSSGGIQIDASGVISTRGGGDVSSGDGPLLDGVFFSTS